MKHFPAKLYVLWLGILLPLLGCNSVPQQTSSSPPASVAGSPSATAIVSPSDRPALTQPPISAQTISAKGIGAAQFGMTLGEVKQALGPETSFKVESPYIVDFDAIAVQQGKETLFYILYPAVTQLGDTDKFEILLTDNPQFQTAEGVGPGMALQQAETIYGQATLSYHTANESREYVKFAQQPADRIHFRPQTQDKAQFAGIYPSPAQEYNETQAFAPDAAIKTVEILCPAQNCLKP
ncbi:MULTISPECIES: hypothetical protein [Trichocoleus]|uniref:Lipoprotein n=1 Tax=Trichocoleus desertorum GB2-A4 TaxID=2933944 RepID=A0ABV0JBG6_9CYAN|nr:hypothetical protein [Trichocoleus sp. FACHB-46]